MKNITIISSVFIVIVVGSFLFVLNNGEPNKTNDSAQNDSTSSSETNKSAVTSFQSGGAYVEYSEANVASTAGDKYLFFHAPWCPQCVSVERGILSGGVPKGVSIFKVDYDSSTELKKRYQVNFQTTFVKLDENNDKIDSFIAYNDPTFDSVLKNFILK